MLTTGQTHKKPHRADSRRGGVAIRVLFRVFFAHGEGATPRPASMDVAPVNCPRPSRSRTPKRLAKRQPPRPLSGRGARALFSVAPRRTLDFGWCGTGFDGVLIVLRPDVIKILGERVDRLTVLVGGGVVGGSGCVGVGFDGVHFGVVVGVAPLTGDGERMTQCATDSKNYFTRCAKFFFPLNSVILPTKVENID